MEVILMKYEFSFSLKESLLPPHLELGNAGWQGQLQGVELHLSWLVFFLQLPNVTVKVLNFNVVFIYILVKEILVLQKVIPEEQKLLLFPEYR